jgi:hypothetical protein
VGRGVFVLGMHRSGTSAATRLINLLGVPTCVEKDLFPPSEDSPRGNWESVSLTAFNDRLLGALGFDWTCPVSLARGWENDPGLGWLYHEAAELFPQVVPGDRWVWKDPRNCVVFPFWRRGLAVRPVVVLVHRNPLEIARSLDARGGLGKLHALALWERYLRLALVAISGLPTLVTGYAALLGDPVRWGERVGEFLTRSGVATGRADEADVLRFVDRGLQHARATPVELAADRALSEPQRALHAALERARGAHAVFETPTLPAETASTETLLSERRRAVRTHPSWVGA